MRFSAAIAAVAALTLVGCGGSGNGIINVPNPRVRFANVFPGIPVAKAQVGSDIISSNIPFGTVSDAVITPNGNKDLTVGDSTFSNLATLSSQLYETQKRYTAIGYGTGPRTILLVEDDKDQATNNTVALRLIHAAQGGANVDVYVYVSGDPFPASPAIANLAAGATSSYIEVPVSNATTSIRVQVFTAGSVINPLVDKTISMDEQERFTFIHYTDSGQVSGFNTVNYKDNL